MVAKTIILVPPAFSNSSCLHPRYQNVTVWLTVTAGDVIQAFVVLALTFAVLFSNILLISVINSRRYAKYIHSQPRYLLTSLACNDLAMGLCVTPFAILSSLRNCWPYAEIVCQVQALLRGAISQQSAVILICMAMDRYYCMLHPLEYHKRTSRKAWFIIIISVTWVGSMALFSVLVIKHGGFYFNSTGMHACEPFYPKASLRILSACGFYFPTTMILMYCYGSAFDVNKLGFKRPNIGCNAISSTAMEAQQTSSIEKRHTMGSNKIKCCDVSFKFLRMCRFFPEEGKQNSVEFLLSVVLTSAINYLMIASILLNISIRLKRQSDLEVIQFAVVSSVSLCGVTWIKYFCIKNRHLLITLAELISDFTTFGKPTGFEEFNAKMNKFARLHLLYIISGSILYFIVFAPMHVNNCTLMNLERNLTEICALFMPIEVPFVDYSTLGTTPILYVINTLSCLLLVHIYTCCGTLLWINIEMVEYISLRIRHMKEVMLDAFKNDSNEEKKRLFKKAMRYHIEILKMGHLADKFFGAELFLHVILTGAVLGVSAFVILVTQKFEVLMIFVGWLNAIIMGSISGQRLINESESIPSVLNHVNWYSFENDLKKDIVFFLMRCKKPMHIKAGNVTMTNQVIMELIDQERKLSIVCSRTMAAMSLGFIVLVTPWTIQEVVAACTGSRAPPALDFVATWMALSSSFWYPFIYWTLNNHFRRICRETFGGVFQRRTHGKRKPFDHFCTNSPGCNYVGHTADCDLEGLSEKYWGEILERTVSSGSLPNPAGSKPDCNGAIELRRLDGSLTTDL